MNGANNKTFFSLEDEYSFNEVTVGGTVAKKEGVKIKNQHPEKVYEDSTLNQKQYENADQVSEVLESIKVTIFEVMDDTVRVKIKDDLFITVPKVLFYGKDELLKYGQPLVYSIKKRGNGTRFQDFELDPTPSENLYKDEISKVLASIIRKE